MEKYLNQILTGDCIEVMRGIPDASVDAVFADAPYNLQLGAKTLYRPEDQTAARAVRDAWDAFESPAAYDDFTRAWLAECKRVLKPDGAMWVIGSYHNIFRVGAILQDLGFWILNDIVWVKTNPSLHNTQKPLDLLRRVILASTNAGDIILDPFLGSGTTAAAARELGRNFIGIEREESYVAAARERVNAVTPIDLSDIEVTTPKRAEIRVAFRELIEAGLLYVGQTLVSPRGERVMITRDGQLTHTLHGKASIHVMAAKLQHTASFNGWDYWSAEKRDGSLVPIDELRKYIRGLKRDMKKVA